MKIITLLLVLAFCVFFSGCARIYGPVEEVKVFADEKEDVLSQMGKKLEAAPTEAGVDEARKIFEAHKDSLKTKRDFLKAAPRGLNSDWQTLLYKTEDRHNAMLDAIGAKLIFASASEECKKKWGTLAADFKNSVKRD